MAEPERKRARDEEIVAVVVKVILREGSIASQKRLAELVNKDLRRRGLRVTPARVRVLAVKSGLVALTIRARTGGETPELKACPVCRAKLKRTENRTLTGKAASTGYKCTRCPWWTGRELRTPHHYTFHARVQRASDEDAQLAFVPSRPKDARL